MSPISHFLSLFFSLSLLFFSFKKSFPQSSVAEITTQQGGKGSDRTRGHFSGQPRALIKDEGKLTNATPPLSPRGSQQATGSPATPSSLQVIFL